VVAITQYDAATTYNTPERVAFKRKRSHWHLSYPRLMV